MTQGRGSGITGGGPPHTDTTNEDQVLKEQGRSQGGARKSQPSAWRMPAPPAGPQRPHTPGWAQREVCQLPLAPVSPGQACCSQPMSRMSPDLPPLCPGPGPALPRKLRFGAYSLHWQGGVAAPTPDAGHALLDANEHTPYFPRPTKTHTPRPAAKQQAGRFVRVRTRSWNSPPVATQYSKHNWRRLCNCLAWRSWACGESSPSSHHSCPDANIATLT